MGKSFLLSGSQLSHLWNGRGGASVCHLHYSQQTYSINVQIVNILGIFNIGPLLHIFLQPFKNVKTLLSSSAVQNRQQDPWTRETLAYVHSSLIKDLYGSSDVRARNWKQPKYPSRGWRMVKPSHISCLKCWVAAKKSEVCKWHERSFQHIIE